MKPKSTAREVERAGIVFELQAERGDDGRWRFSVRRLSHGYHVHEHGPVEYQPAIAPVPDPDGTLKQPQPTDEQRLADGLRRADNWVLENLHRWIE